MIPRRLVAHPSCVRDWFITSIRSLPDGAYEIRACPRTIPPFRVALEDEQVAHLSRPSAEPDKQLHQPECVFYVEPDQ